MTKFKGFKTKQQAKDYVDKNGGMLTWEQYTPTRHKLTKIGKYYMLAVNFGGLNKNEYPYCVQWNEYEE